MGFDHTDISRHPEALEAFAQAPLLHSKGSARLATEFLATVNWIQTHHRDLCSPLLILHGAADQIALPEGSRSFFQQLVFSEKDYREYPEGRHALHSDLNRQEMLRDLENWLSKHQTGRSIRVVQTH